MAIPNDFVLMAVGATPFLDNIAGIVRGIFNVIEDVKVCRQQCKDLSYRCRELLLALRDATAGLEDTRCIQMVDAAEAIISKVYTRLQTWATYNRVKSYLMHSEVKQGIERSHEELDTCVLTFNISMNIDHSRGHRDILSMQERDHAELREMLQAIMRDMGDVRYILQRTPPAAVEGIMQTLQEELHNPGLAAVQEQTFKRGLWLLHEGSDTLPPLIDLTGQVSRISERPVAYGAFNDIYTGRWLDSETVALRLPRALTNNPGVQERLQKEVRIWRSLRHPNIVPLYGLARLGEHNYLVSPWMDHGNVLTYLANHDNADRLQLLIQVAYGMENLHQNQVIHGDLRGSNVLVSKDGVAKLSDFGLSRFLEEGGQCISCPAGVNPRWFAPEIIGQSGAVSKSSDVWSFGMLALELMTGEQPFSHIQKAISVMYEVTHGKLPEKPGEPANSRGLGQELWALMLRCWAQDPDSRPSMTEVRSIMEQIKAERRAPTVLQSAHIRPRSVHSTFSFSSSSQLPAQIRPSTSDSISIRSEYTYAPQSGGAFLRHATFPSETGSIQTDIRSSSDSIMSWNSWEDPPGGDVWRPMTPISQCSSPTQTTAGGPPSEHTPVSPDTLAAPAHTPTSAERAPGTSTFDGVQDDLRISRESRPAVTHNGPPPAASSSGRGTFLLRLATSRNRSTLRGLYLPLTGAKGSPEGGTTEELIERLIASTSNVAEDLRYRKIFLATYLLFTNCGVVFGKLRRAFEITQESIDRRVFDARQTTPKDYETLMTRRYDIMAVMKDWCTGASATADQRVLTETKEFAQSIKGAQLITDMAKQLIVAIDERQDEDSSETQEPPTSPKSPRPSDTKPEDIAIALTMVEAESYRRLRPADYIHFLLRHPGPNSVEAANATSAKVESWVKRTVLRSEELKSRVEVFKFFIHIAEECRRLRNFSSAIAILKALTSPAVQRLKLTHRQLAKNDQKMLAGLSKLLDTSNNYRQYRSALNKSQANRIPWITVHLQDLRNALNEHPATISVDSNELVNFTRCISFEARLQEVMRLESPNLYDLHHPDKLAYVRTQLRRIRPSDRLEREFGERSLQLAKGEERLRDSRTIELAGLGLM